MKKVDFRDRIMIVDGLVRVEMLKTFFLTREIGIACGHADAVSLPSQVNQAVLRELAGSVNVLFDLFGVDAVIDPGVEGCFFLAPVRFFHSVLAVMAGFGAVDPAP